MNFTILALFLIVIIGLYFRILPYDNIQGLWNDEYVGWYVSQKPLFIPFIKGIFEQCHMPLYYLYLKFITFIFGNSDVILRLSSFITGILSVIVMYYVGKTKNNVLALLCSFFTAISGILIYYSYEVRPYSLIFLFSALSLLFSLKLIDELNKKNMICYILSNCAILFTHTIGFVYVICNFIFVGYFIKNKKSEFFRKIIFSTGIFFLLLTPLIINIFTTISFSQWWSNYSFSKLLFLLTDIFSSDITNLINAPSNFLVALNLKFLFFGILPAIICILGILNILITKNKAINYLFLTALIPIIILLLVSLSGKLVFTTKYNFEVYPILIYLSMLGLLEFKNKILKIVLVVLLLIINTSYLFTPNYKQNFIKMESNKLVADLLINANLKPDDIILFTYYPRERFSKYFDYSQYEIREVHKGNFFYYLTPHTSYYDVVTNAPVLYRKLYLSKKNDYFSDMVEKEFYQNLREGKRIAIIFLDSVSLFSDVQLYQLSTNDKYYKKTPQMFMIFSYVKNFLIKKMYNDLKIVKYEQKGAWSIVIFKK